MSEITLSVLTDAGSVDIVTIHRGQKDSSPLHMVSESELARMKQMEAAYLALLDQLSEEVDVADIAPQTEKSP
jgi:hypothetical protein